MPWIMLDWVRLKENPIEKNSFLIVCRLEQWSSADECMVDYTVYINPDTKQLFAEKIIYEDEGAEEQVVWFSIGI